MLHRFGANETVGELKRERSRFGGHVDLFPTYDNSINGSVSKTLSESFNILP